MRVNHRVVMPEAFEALMSMHRVADASGLDPKLLELVRLRASQINGCAFCLDAHSRAALAAGESARRLHVVAAWREAPFYDARERAALAWCESLTLLSETGAPDAVYEGVAAAFAPREQVALTAAVAAINAWNRFTVGFRIPVRDVLPGVPAGDRLEEPRA